MTSRQEPNQEVSFAETAMRLSGKTEEEARRTGAVDQADDQVEAMFAPQYKTTNSPIHRAVWENEVPIELFCSPGTTGVDLPAMKKSIDVLVKHRQAGTIWDGKDKVADVVLKDLADAGYWGMLIEPEYGGQGVSVLDFMRFLSKVATIDPTCAGLASVHGCIGAVDPVRSFGNEEQKNRFLPKLASGDSLSAFALTEPAAGSDLTVLRTVAELKGNDYIVNGEKLFITNGLPGRTIGLVVLINGKPQALIAELPKAENEHFQIVSYGLHALKHAYNHGLKFKNFAIPKNNLLVPPAGDGLTVAYHGLNLGRLALCATASGVMKVLLANILPWAHFRETYGQAIETRELVKRRIARTSALIVGAEALVSWGSSLLDKGYRGELECIIAKIFGSEAEKEVAIEYFMKTHGGRSFLRGHMFGDNVHDFLAPCIYEGEGEMLGMAFFKALAKHHGKTYFEPVGQALKREGLRKLDPMNPLHLWKLKNELLPYAVWWFGKTMSIKGRHELTGMNLILREHVEFAIAMLSELPLQLSEAMVKHQLKLADRQCRIAELSQRVQDTIVILVSSLWAHQQKNEVLSSAADILCQDLKRKLTGQQPSDQYYKATSNLADSIIEGGFRDIVDIKPADILFSYEKSAKVKTPTIIS